MSEDENEKLELETVGVPETTVPTEDQKIKYDRFGRYLILDHLVDGGMAKICRARFLGEQANKIVAIKMVQPQYSKDPTFMTMFEDELKVSFGLQHPNIVQIYDYGMYKEQLFSAMEYVHGRNLKEYLDMLKEKKFVFPVEICVYIISQVCQALNYAHTFTDKLTGKPYNIVHRDISPHNIMLTYDGSVKVIDFGIAKADTNKEATQAGTIKGKLSYLAPEYLEGLKLDPRYDEFAVGITLWEMLCMRKLFTASNDLAVLKQIQACKIPAPSTINPNVPKELDEIVLKSLSKDRNNRYEDMDKFNRALIKFLYSKYPDFNATDLAFFAKQLYKEDIEKDQHKFVEYGKIDLAPFIQDLNSEGKSSVAHKIKGPQQTVLEFDFNDENSLDINLTGKAKANPPKKTGLTGIHKAPTGEDLAGKTGTIKSKKPMLTLKKTPGPAAAAPGAEKLPDLPPAPAGSPVTGTPSAPEAKKAEATTVGKTNPNATTTKTAVVKKAASDSKTDIKKTVAAKPSEGGSKFKSLLILVATVAGVFYYKAEWIAEKTGFDPFNKGKREIASVEAASQIGKLFISGLDPYMDVYIDGKKKDFPGLGIELPLAKSVKLEIRKEGHEAFIKAISLKEKVLKVEVPALKAEKAGMLTTSKESFREGMKMRLKVSGRDAVVDLPIENYRLPAGKYQATVVDPVLETEKAVEFEIEESKLKVLE